MGGIRPAACNTPSRFWVVLSGCLLSSKSSFVCMWPFIPVVLAAPGDYLARSFALPPSPVKIQKRLHGKGKLE